MELGHHDDTTQWYCMALLSCPMPVFYATRWGYFLCKSLGAPLEGVRKNPPPYSAPFACLPKPHHLVLLKSGLGPITTCLRPFWWLIFTFVRNGPLSRICDTPPSCWRGGF